MNVVAQQATVNIVALAGSLPRDPQFRAWLDWLAPSGTPINEDGCAEYIRQICGIKSRRQLAEDRDAEQRFHTLLRKPFVEWRNEQF